MSHLLRPYTNEEIRLNLDHDGYISGEVAVALNDIIHTDFEGFLDLISEKLVGTLLLADISYEVSGVSGSGDVVIKITGDPSDVLRN
jgi:hypothetical protein